MEFNELAMTSLLVMVLSGIAGGPVLLLLLLAFVTVGGSVVCWSIKFYIIEMSNVYNIKYQISNIIPLTSDDDADSQGFGGDTISTILQSIFLHAV